MNNIYSLQLLWAQCVSMDISVKKNSYTLFSLLYPLSAPQGKECCKFLPPSLSLHPIRKINESYRTYHRGIQYPYFV